MDLNITVEQAKQFVLFLLPVAALLMLYSWKYNKPEYTFLKLTTIEKRIGGLVILCFTTIFIQLVENGFGIQNNVVGSFIIAAMLCFIDAQIVVSLIRDEFSVSIWNGFAILAMIALVFAKMFFMDSSVAFFLFSLIFCEAMMIVAFPIIRDRIFARKEVNRLQSLDTSTRMFTKEGNAMSPKPTQIIAAWFIGSYYTLRKLAPAYMIAITSLSTAGLSYLVYMLHNDVVQYIFIAYVMLEVVCWIVAEKLDPLQKPDTLQHDIPVVYAEAEPTWRAQSRVMPHHYALPAKEEVMQ